MRGKFIQLGNDLNRATRRAKINDSTRIVLLECVDRHFWDRRTDVPFICSGTEMAEAVGLSVRAAQTAIGSLVGLGILKHVGSGACGRRLFLLEEDPECWGCAFRVPPSDARMTMLAANSWGGAHEPAPPAESCAPPQNPAPHEPAGRTNVRGNPAGPCGGDAPRSQPAKASSGALKDKRNTVEDPPLPPLAAQTALPGLGERSPIDPAQDVHDHWRRYGADRPANVSKGGAKAVKALMAKGVTVEKMKLVIDHHHRPESGWKKKDLAFCLNPAFFTDRLGEARTWQKESEAWFESGLGKYLIGQAERSMTRGPRLMPDTPEALIESIRSQDEDAPCDAFLRPRIVELLDTLRSEGRIAPMAQQEAS